MKRSVQTGGKSLELLENVITEGRLPAGGLRQCPGFKSHPVCVTWIKGAQASRGLYDVR